VSWKATLKRGLHRVAHHSGASVLRTRRQRGMRVLKFHGVGGADYPAAALAAELEYLRRHFPIVPLADVVHRVRAGQGGRDHGIALTFDDGLRNNYTVVYPILKRLGLCATFFICPSLVDTGRWLWNHEARERLRTLPGEERREIARRVHAPTDDPDGVVSWMKSLVPTAREEIEGRIRMATPDFRPTPEQRQRFDVMTWDDLATLDADSVAIGAHTMTHPVLPLCNSDETAWELGESQRSLEARLARPVEHFCYPFGAWNASVADLVRRWYRSAVTSAPGWITAGDDPYGLKRISATPRLPLLTWRLHRPTA
jgi:peptidoglycan/xylan/chitin deacetylase (PgdA/CDA1 family)